MNHPSLRLTPSNSPFYKSSTPKSPTKSRNEEPGLRLKKVIGTTTSSSTGFDCLPAAKQFAYTAGAAAVVCTVQDDLKVTQRFFRARPTTGAGPWEVNGHGPLSPLPADTRNRVLGGVGGSPLGASVRDWSESPSGKSTTAKDRVKAATSVALSPNGKWLALGETGYKPRILIFANKDDLNDTPVCALSEHTFGVHALAFSPDGRFLASLGTVNDGFLYIWSIDNRTGAATLHSSNKCTVVVSSMIWVGSSLLTVGLRFVKCWRPDEDGVTDRRVIEPSSNAGTPKQKASDFGNSIWSPKHKYLPGRNSLLGDLIDVNFVAAVALANDRAVVCTDAGDICILDDCQGFLKLTPTAQAGFRITAAALDERGIFSVAGPDNRIRTFAVADLGAPVRVNRRQTISPMKGLSSSTVSTIAMASMGNVCVALDTARGVRLTEVGEEVNGESPLRQITAHNETVQGVQAFSSTTLQEAAFFTFSINGSVHIWSSAGEHVSSIDVPVETSPAMYDLTNELRAVSTLSNGCFLAAGDKYGTLSLVNVSDGKVHTQVRAHSAEVVDILAYKRAGVQLVATASRDRMLQLFSFVDNQLELLQTMDEHAAAVSGLLIAKGGDLLLSCSTDRTIVVREVITKESNPTAIAYAILRTITLKSSPTSMCLKPGTNDVFVSTVDRSVVTYNINNGQAGFSFKCSDSDGGEATALSRVVYAPSLNGNPTIVGVSTSDKSVRLYSEFGSLIARDWGHTEGITDAALLDEATAGEGEQSAPPQLITVAADSTVFMWDTASQVVKPAVPQSGTNGLTVTPSPNKLSTPIGPPLRKVLSFTELSRFKRERGVDEDRPDFSPEYATPTQRAQSPPRIRKKTSRMSIAQPPRLEPAFRTSFAEQGRRRSLKNRSPSPTSPRSGIKKELTRKPSLGMSLRSKSSDNVLTSAAAGNTNNGFGSVNASTESVCRTLKAYRKKLTGASKSDAISAETLRELENELKLTARVVAEKCQGSSADEALLARLLGQASDRIVSRLDEHIKEKVENEVRRKSGQDSVHGEAIIEEASPMQMEAVTEALEKVSLNDR